MDKIRGRILATLIFSLAVVFGLIVLSEPVKFFQVLRNADPAILIIAAFTVNLPLLVYAFTWQRMFKAVGVELSYVNSFRVLLTNTFINNVTPFGNIGGEAAATYFISKISDHEAGKIFSAIFISSLINLSPLFTLLLVGLAVNSYLLYLMIVIAMTTGFLVFLYLAGSWDRFFEIGIFDRLPGKVSGFLSEFRDSIENFESSKPTLLVLIVLGHLATLFDVLGIILVGLALGIDLFHPLILLVIPLGRLSNYFPTPGGTGSYELAFTSLLVLFFGLTAAEAVSVALVYRLLTYYFGLIAGYISAVSLGFKPNILSKEK